MGMAFELEVVELQERYRTRELYAVPAGASEAAAALALQARQPAGPLMAVPQIGGLGTRQHRFRTLCSPL